MKVYNIMRKVKKNKKTSYTFLKQIFLATDAMADVLMVSNNNFLGLIYSTCVRVNHILILLTASLNSYSPTRLTALGGHK